MAAPKPVPLPPTQTELERSVVVLENTSQRADWRTPWNPGRPQRSLGSGFVIEGGRILTNAHVVADSRNLVFHYLRLKRPETIIFRMDHRVGNGRWEEGPSCTLDIVLLDYT